MPDILRAMLIGGGIGGGVGIGGKALIESRDSLNPSYPFFGDAAQGIRDGRWLGF
jgi:hypothetical protein